MQQHDKISPSATYAIGISRYDTLPASNFTLQEPQ